MLLWMSIALGGIAGAVFGLTNSKTKRRNAGYMIWYLALASCCALEVYRLTGKARHHNPLGADNKSGSKQLFLIGFCCMVIAWSGYNMQQGQPTHMVAVPMVILAAITAIVIAQHDRQANLFPALLTLKK